ncbi:TPA: hypothetical protein ACGO3Z_001873 [Streptococcus suis]
MKMIRFRSAVMLLDERECLNLFQESYTHNPEKKDGVVISLEDATVARTDRFDGYFLTGSMYIMADEKLDFSTLEKEIERMKSSFNLSYKKQFGNLTNPYTFYFEVTRWPEANETTISCKYAILLTRNG